MSGTIVRSERCAESATFLYMDGEVGIAELRRNLSAYLRRVAEGERFIVTDHNRPVATLGPPLRRSSVLDRLIAEGKAIPPKRPPGTTPPITTPGPPTLLTDALIAQRREERW
jgi:prevent-host-death family protein